MSKHCHLFVMCLLCVWLCSEPFMCTISYSSHTTLWDKYYYFLLQLKKLRLRQAVVGRGRKKKNWDSERLSNFPMITQKVSGRGLVCITPFGALLLTDLLGRLLLSQFIRWDHQSDEPQKDGTWRQKQRRGDGCVIWAGTPRSQAPLCLSRADKIQAARK